MELYIAVVIGCLLNLLFGLNEVFGKPEFQWNLFFKNNLVPTVINLVCGAVLVWFREDIVSIYPLGGLSAVFLGFGGQTIFKKLAKMMDSKIDTFVGINK